MDDGHERAKTRGGRVTNALAMATSERGCEEEKSGDWPAPVRAHVVVQNLRNADCEQEETEGTEFRNWSPGQEQSLRTLPYLPKLACILVRAVRSLSNSRPQVRAHARIRRYCR